MFGFPLSGKPRPLRLDVLSGDDAPACARLHAQSFPHPWDAYDFERLIGAASGFGHAAREARGGGLLGFILSRRAADEAEVLTIAVEIAGRRAGIGRRLLEANVAALGRNGARQLFLDVGEENVAARALYARAGFAEVGRRAGYYRDAAGRQVSALTMRRAIV